ncbi:MAG TPA: hypothetical protein VMU83_17740 [Hanamia sp.]|nr:hypothetical protein [Hanamia sp.]
MNNYDTAEKKSEEILTTRDLSIAIKRLERKRVLIEEDMKDHFHLLLEDLKPANILRNTLHEVQESTPLKHNLLKIAVGLGAGYFSRKLVVGKSAGLVKKALGTALQFGITQFIAKKSEDSDENNSESTSKKKNLLRRILSV